MTKISPKIGAHVSCAGGLHKAIENARRIGAECIQIFGASPHQWSVRLPLKEEVERYRKELIAAKIGPVFLHAAYLVNLASPEPGARNKSIASLIAHMKITEAIGAQGLIFHMGSTKGSPRDEALKHTVEGMNAVLRGTPGKTQLVMENSAGGGGKLGSKLPELGNILHAVRSARIKVCIDTAHLFESGTIASYTAANVKNFCTEFNREIGLENLAAMHINDSKTISGSHLDRHANIGEGFIGLSGFKNLAENGRLNHAAWILEVPGFDGMGPDQKNIEIVRSCFEG